MQNTKQLNAKYKTFKTARIFLTKRFDKSFFFVLRVGTLAMAAPTTASVA